MKLSSPPLTFFVKYVATQLMFAYCVHVLEFDLLTVAAQQVWHHLHAPNLHSSLTVQLATFACHEGLNKLKSMSVKNTLANKMIG
jgi:hypothetical protein